MAKQGMVCNGEVAFSNVTQMDTYNGKQTNYNVVVKLDDGEAQKLEDMGVKLKNYEGVMQKKFTTTFGPVEVLDVNGDRVAGEIPFGSKVRVLWSAGDVDPTHGLKAYLEKVRVVEMAEGALDTPEEF